MTDPDRLLAIWSKVEPRVRTAIRNAGIWRDGYPTGSTGAGGGSSRTETLAVRHHINGDRHTQLLVDIEKAVMALARLVDQAAPSNAAADHLAAKTEDRCPAGWCESCWRNGGHHSPTKNPTGRMCRWCEDTARSLGVEQPPLTLVRMHNEGRKITDRDVRLSTGGRHGGA